MGKVGLLSNIFGRGTWCLMALCVSGLSASASAETAPQDTTCYMDLMCVVVGDALSSSTTARTGDDPGWTFTTEANSFGLVFNLEIYDRFAFVEVINKNEVRGSFQGRYRAPE